VLERYTLTDWLGNSRGGYLAFTAALSSDGRIGAEKEKSKDHFRNFRITRRLHFLIFSSMTFSQIH
jgi:hypothetical protein